jgi:hypothetical protein
MQKNKEHRILRNLILLIQTNDNPTGLTLIHKYFQAIHSKNNFDAPFAKSINATDQLAALKYIPRAAH